MTSAPSRKNDPQAVRSRLLDCAARLIVDHGLSTLTLERVAREAGVSKGGLLHHYPGKDALIGGLFDQVVEWFDCQVDAVLKTDEASSARFSRAYLQVIGNIDMSVPEEKRLAVLILMLSSDPQCSAKWNGWVDSRLRQHHLTDANPLARTLRLAADGLWLSDLSGGPDSQLVARGEILRFLEGLNTAHGIPDTKSDQRGQ